MPIPSLLHIYREASRSIRRFPFALASSAVAVVCAVWMIEIEYSERSSYEFLYKLIMISTLGISWFTVIVLTLEKWGKGKMWVWLGQLGGLVVLALYYLTLPDDLLDAPAKHGIRFALFFIGTHLLVAIAPFWRKGETEPFWQYNKTLFLQLLTALLYSMVLYLGLVIAMLSVVNLFEVEVPEERYAQLWLLIIGIFNTWFFLSGIPSNLRFPETVQSYPNGLKIFTQFILIPLVTVYLVILYLYELKILLEWQWPEGWVAILVLSFSTAGIFSLLLLHPIRDRVENKWIGSYSRYYFRSLAPLVILLLLAIWRRISEYGITENRYFVLILGFWLAGMVAYFIFSRSKSIKVIPATLCFLAFFSALGPWGAFSVSENSQVNRLEQLLMPAGILVNGEIRPATQPVTPETAGEISAIVRYLSDVHGLEGIDPWFDSDLDTLTSSHPRQVVKMMGVDYVEAWENSSSSRRSFSSDNRRAIPVVGYDRLVRSRSFHQQRDTSSISIDTYRLMFRFNHDSLRFTVSEERQQVPVLEIELAHTLDSLARSTHPGEGYNIPAEKLSFGDENDWIKVRLDLNSVQLQRSGDRWTAQSIQADILISFK